MATKALAVKQYVRNLTQATLAEVETTWSPVRTIPRKWAVIGSVRWDTSEWGPYGNRSRDEVFNVRIGLYCHLPGDSAESAEALVMDWANRLETAIRADANLGGLVPQGAALIPVQVESGPVDAGSEAHFLCDVRAKARI